METTHVSSIEHKAEVNGISVSYTDTGEGEIPLLFIHGFPFNKSLWQPQQEFFKKNNRVIAYDIRGFGKSTSGSETASIDLFASDLLGLMDHLKIKKAIACGLSMGGYILMNAVSRSPEKFHAAILSDTQCSNDSDEAKEKRYDSIKQIEKEGLETFGENFIKVILSKKTLENKAWLVNEVKKMILSAPVKAVTAALHALAQRRESCTLLKKVHVPSLILYGKEDGVIPASQFELLFNTLENSKLQVIEDAGHLANVEQPEVFNSYLLNFMNDL